MIILEDQARVWLRDEFGNLMPEPEPRRHMLRGPLMVLSCVVLFSAIIMIGVPFLFG